MIIASCPTRISLGSADHEPFSSTYGGVALNICIDKRIYVILRQRNKLEEHNYRVSYSKTELCNTVEEIKLDIVREAIKLLKIDNPLEVIYFADVPAKLGLATSSAFILALLKALYTLKGDSIAPEMLAETAYVLERDLIKQPGGYQDQYIGWGGINYLTGKPHQVKRSTIAWNPETISEFESHLLLVYTGNRIPSEDVLTEQLQLLKKGTTLEQSLLIKKLVEEMYTMMKSPSFKPMELAYPMMEQWNLKKQLSSMMTTEAVVDIENKVKDVCPQSGLRLIGSGGRGCMLVLAPPDYHESIIDRLQGYVCSSFSIDWEGCKVRKGNGY